MAVKLRWARQIAPKLEAALSVLRGRSQRFRRSRQKWRDSGIPGNNVNFLGASMRKILIATLTGAVMASGVAQAANSNTTTTTFTVTATVQSTCSATAAALAFPNYTPGGGPLTGNTTISVKCTKNTPFAVSLNAG